MLVFGLHVDMCAICMLGPHGSPKKALDALELEQQRVVSYHCVVLEILT